MGKELRISRFLDPGDGCAIIVKADQGLALGPIEGLEDIESSIAGIMSANVDGVVLSPGQAGRQAHLFKGKAAPAMLVRSDWSNVMRDQSFPLPWKRMTHVAISGAGHAAYLGAEGIVASFYVGYRDDQDEANNIEAISHLGAECFQYGLPLLVEALPLGERITEHNFLDSLKMSARMSLEAGADGLIVPYGGSRASMGEIVSASGKAPVLLMVDEVERQVVADAIDAGVRGVVLGRTAFVRGPREAVQRLRELLKSRG